MDQLKSRPIVSCPGSLNNLFILEFKYPPPIQRKYNNDYPKDAIRAGLRLIMTMNLTLKQLNGTAMGTPPALPYATIIYGLHEEKFLPHHAQRVIFYRRFIDDVIGIWCPNNNHKQDTLEWDNFKNKMNAFPGLTWEFSERDKTIDFMDMTISINNSNKIETTLFEKRLNFHLYIPSHYAHPPGLLPGIVYGTFFRILTYVQTMRINYNEQRFFFERLIARGYKGNDIRTLFHKAIMRAKAYNGPVQAEDDDHNIVILHLPFHPNDPTHVAKPHWKLPLEHMKNPKTKEKCNIKRMIIVYKRPMNLGNLLSQRDLATGPPVSSYLYD